MTEILFGRYVFNLIRITLSSVLWLPIYPALSANELGLIRHPISLRNQWNGEIIHGEFSFNKKISCSVCLVLFFKYSRSLCACSRVTVDYFNTKNSFLAVCFWSTDIIGGKVIILWKLKEVFHRGIMPYFITDSLVVRVFQGNSDLLCCLKTAEGHCSQMLLRLPPVPYRPQFWRYERHRKITVCNMLHSAGSYSEM